MAKKKSTTPRTKKTTSEKVEKKEVAPEVKLNMREIYEIKITKDFNTLKKDEVKKVTGEIAQILIQRGIAKLK